MMSNINVCITKKTSVSTMYFEKEKQIVGVDKGRKYIVEIHIKNKVEGTLRNFNLLR